MNVKKDVLVTTDFAVADADGNPVTGISSGAFAEELYNPSGSEVSGSITVTFSELGGGAYRATFTPDTVGDWYLRIIHATHFPWGKSDGFSCSEANWDDVDLVRDLRAGRWKVDESVNQIIFYKEDNVTEVRRYNLLDENGNPAFTNVFERTKV